MQIINQALEFIKQPQFYYYAGGGLLIIILLYLLFKKKNTSSSGGIDNLIKNFLSIVIVSVLTLQIFLGTRKNVADKRIKEDIDDNEDKKKELDDLKNNIENEIQDKKKSIKDIEEEIEKIQQEKNNIKKESDKNTKSLKDISNKLKNL